MWRRKRFWAGLAVAAACLFFVFRKTEFGQLADAFARADYRWLVLALPLYLFGYYLRAVRWRYILSPIKRVPTARLLPVLLIGFMANNVLPLRVGEFVRPYLAGRREGISRSASFATVVLERVFDGLTMLAIFAVSSTFLTTRVEKAMADPHFTILGRSGAEVFSYMDRGVKVSAAVFLALLVGAFLTISFKERSLAAISRLARLLPGGLSAKAEEILHKFVTGLAVLQSRTEMVYVFGLSALAWTLEGFTYFLVAQAFSIPLSFPSILMLMALVNLAIMVPTAPGGWGPFELVGVAFLKLLTVPEAVGLAFVLVVHAIIIFPITAWGLYHAGRAGLSLRQIQETASTREESKLP